MSATAERSQSCDPIALVAARPSGVTFVETWLAARRPSCCPDARCRCDCGCARHSHYFRCRDCAFGRHHPPRPVVVPLAARAALAFEEWPPVEAEPAVDHLAHLRHLMRDRPTEVH